MDASDNYIKYLEHRVKRKLQRIARSGIDLRNTPYNPIIVDKPEGYDVLKYAARLREFTDRKTQFIALAKGDIVPRSKWREYKRMEKAYNDKVAKFYAKHKDKPVTDYETVANRMARAMPDQKRAAIQTHVVNAPYGELDRNPRGVASGKALDKLIAQMNDRLQPDYWERRREGNRNAADSLVRGLGLHDIAVRLNSLPDDDFDFIWNYTSFANTLALGYEFSQKLLTPKEQAFHRDLVDQSVRELKNILERVTRR